MAFGVPILKLERSQIYADVAPRRKGKLCYLHDVQCCDFKLHSQQHRNVARMT